MTNSLYKLRTLSLWNRSV